MALKTYDPKKVSIIIGGVAMQGYTDGTFASLEYDEDAFTKVVGADGETSRSKTNNNSGVLTITLKQTSLSNDALFAFAEVDRLTNLGVYPFLLKDNSGNMLATSPTCWVKKQPTVSFGKEIEDREWVIDIADLFMKNGGNANFEAE